MPLHTYFCFVHVRDYLWSDFGLNTFVNNISSLSEQFQQDLKNKTATYHGNFAKELCTIFMLLNNCECLCASVGLPFHYRPAVQGRQLLITLLRGKVSLCKTYGRAIFWRDGFWAIFTDRIRRLFVNLDLSDSSDVCNSNHLPCRHSRQLCQHLLFADIAH